ncbi:MAG: hypothetical protein PVH08_03385, partial [Syntrophobacterales bacterium]
RWLRNYSPFTVHRLLFFAMRYALCSMRSDLAPRTRFSMLNKPETSVKEQVLDVEYAIWSLPSMGELALG